MRDERTFWLGFTANTDGAYCGLGCGASVEQERNREIGVCADDGSGRRRLVCAGCGELYAPHLQGLVRPAINAIKSHWAQIPSRYVLFDATDYEPIEMPAVDLPIPTALPGDYD